MKTYENKDLDNSTLYFQSNEFLTNLLSALPCTVLVLNDDRRLVFANDRLMERLKIDSLDKLLGKRPGHILSCKHVTGTDKTCGTTDFCKYCGAAKSIIDSNLYKKLTFNECYLTTSDNKSFDFRVWAMPIQNESGITYTIFSLVDISHEKRVQILERSFLHDLNNSLMVLSGYSQMMTLQSNTEKLQSYSESLHKACINIHNEVETHKRILKAEEGKLVLAFSQAGSLAILKEIHQLFSYNENWQDRKIVISESAKDFKIVTDHVLLLRILNNMVKNALEATIAKDEVIKLDCYTSDGSATFSVSNKVYIPEEVRLQIFKRSFSTKGKGRGIGTYSMKLFGEQYLKGNVGFNSSLESGTTFYISIPIN